MDINRSFAEYRSLIEQEIENLPVNKKIPLFYEPINYINCLSGKMIRPVLTVICGLLVGGRLKNLLSPASAIELLHNFSLVHDDIMDEDDTRRGQPTVHVKWGLGIAILTGDGLLGLAYRKLLATPNITDLQITRLFTDAVIEICEGQALDKMFEEMKSVSEAEYIEMILKKTATLIRLSCEIGGIVGEGTAEQVRHLAEFGLNIGLGFQIQDDLLDIYADEQTLGKRVGSDLLMNKKTILTIRLIDKIGKAKTAGLSLDDFKTLLEKHQIVSDVEYITKTYFENARNSLLKLPENDYRQLLLEFSDYIQTRKK